MAGDIVAGDLNSSRPAMFVLSLTACAAVLLLAWVHLREIVTTPVQFDDAFIANVATNLAAGHGYSSSYYRLRPFDPEISTGPLLILPTAAIVALAGNRYWVPNLTYALCVWLATGGVLFLAHHRLRDGQFTTVLALMAIGLIPFTTAEFGLLGEVPAAMMVAIAALLLSRAAHVSPRIGAAGVALGAAVITKNICALALLPFLWHLAVRDRQRRRQSARRFLVGFSIPLLLLELWKVIAVPGGLAGWYALKGEELELYTAGDSLSGAGASPWQIPHTLSQNTAVLLNDWGGVPPLILAVSVTLVAIWGGWGHPHTRERSPVHVAALVLLGAAVVHICWWLLISPAGWDRHLLPGVLYWLVAISLFASMTATRSAWIAPLCVILLIGAVLPQTLKRRALGLGLAESPRLTALRQASARLQALQQDGNVVLLGCGWWHNPDVEYMLPSSESFRDCLRLDAAETAGRRQILVRSEYFNWEGSPDILKFQEACEQHVLFKYEPFVVSECPSAAVRHTTGRAPH